VIRLLIVDDSALARRFLGRIFEAEADFEIAAARDGVEALVQRSAWVRAAYVIGSLAFASACAGMAWSRWGFNIATPAWLAASALFGAGAVVILFLDYARALHRPAGHAVEASFTPMAPKGD
jgi:hypothetical protein